MTEVVRDLMIRGAIRRQQGWTLDKILTTDGRAVINAIYADVAEVAGGIVGELARETSSLISGAIQRHVGSIVESITNSVSGKNTKSR